MYLFSRPSRLILVVCTLLACGLFIVGGFSYFQHTKFQARLQDLESQLVLLATTLAETDAVSKDHGEQLQTLADRSGQAETQDELLTTAVEEAAPAVVSIVISRDVPRLEVEYVNPFGDDPRYRHIPYRVPVYRQVGTESQQIGAGTGFLVRADGYIITNRHVVSDAAADYTALLSSGEQRTARVLYRDRTHDIALLKIDGNNHPTIPLGDSSGLRLGQTVVAIGNALGVYSNSVSVGIISGLNRTVEAQDGRGRVEVLTGVIQTDAAISQGNSGGPLLDLSGNVVGMNVAVDRGGANIAFSIPADVIKAIIEPLF